jgi:hypothetical protein
MSDYEFAGCLFRFRSDLIADIAAEWLCNASDDDLREVDVTEDVKDCVKGWELDDLMRNADFDQDDLAIEFRDYIDARLAYATE